MEKHFVLIVSNTVITMILISKAVRLHDFCSHDTLEQLINRVITTYQQEGQHAPSTWIYEKYGNLVKHELTYLHLDSNAILKNMSQNVISLKKRFVMMFS